MHYIEIMITTKTAIKEMRILPPGLTIPPLENTLSSAKS